jgi:hypothetical protein
MGANFSNALQFFYQNEFDRLCPFSDIGNFRHRIFALLQNACCGVRQPVTALVPWRLGAAIVQLRTVSRDSREDQSAAKQQTPKLIMGLPTMILVVVSYMR